MRVDLYDFEVELYIVALSACKDMRSSKKSVGFMTLVVYMSCFPMCLAFSGTLRLLSSFVLEFVLLLSRSWAPGLLPKGGGQ